MLAAAVVGCSSGHRETKPEPTSTQLDAPITRELDVGGRQRQYRLLLPPNRISAAPVLITLHLYERRGDLPSQTTAIAQAAWRRGVVVAMPVGVSFSWNAGTCCGDARAQGVDDVGFLRALIADVTRRDHIAPDRVYAAGFSNGGFMAYRAACEGVPLAGFAVVDGTLGIDRCVPERPTEALVVHQTGDRVVPVDGAEKPLVPGSGAFAGVRKSFATWRKADGCTGPKRWSRSAGVETTTFPCGEGRRARLVVIDGGGHSWPVEPFDATSEILDFFGL